MSTQIERVREIEAVCEEQKLLYKDHPLRQMINLFLDLRKTTQIKELLDNSDRSNNETDPDRPGH